MSELKAHRFCESDEFFREYTGPLSNEAHLYYRKSEADKVIAELKQKLENVQASMYADVVDANMEVRRLRRALYKACANWAHHRVFVRFKTDEKAWENMERKCRAKAEEYK